MERADEHVCNEVHAAKAQHRYSMYEVYTVKHRDIMPGKPPIWRTLFYTIANQITGGGKLQEAGVGVDYVKVNFHIDNFANVDRLIYLIKILAPLSDVDHTL